MKLINESGHAGTLKYIKDTLHSLGDYYDVSTQDFPVTSWHVYESRLVLGHDVPESAQPIGLSPATPNKQPIFGQVINIKNYGCEASDYPSEVKGNIAFIKRGGCAFGSKSEQARNVGAAAAVIYNDKDGEYNGSLQQPIEKHVPTFALSGEDGKKYLKQLEDGQTLDGIAYIDAAIETVQTTNIIAQTRGGDQDNVVMLGGHSDSVTAGPGINDDGSGSLSLLEIAVKLTEFKVANSVRFAWWSAEEEGLLGSVYYADHLSPKENKKIRLFLDYDMLASPNFAYQIYNSSDAENPKGSEQLRDLYIDWYKAHGLNYTFVPFDGRSDYVGFILHGIPSSGVATGAEGIKTEEEEALFGGKAGNWYDPAYHQLEDDLGNLNLTAWEVNTKLVAHSVATYARSLKGFPAREDVETLGERELPYRGSTLVM